MARLQWVLQSRTVTTKFHPHYGFSSTNYAQFTSTYTERENSLGYIFSTADVACTARMFPASHRTKREKCRGHRSAVRKHLYFGLCNSVNGKMEQD